jgi:long-chain acyl-CoA synthetase
LNLFPALVPHGSVGQALGGHEVIVLDEKACPVADGTVGQIAVRGPSVMRGYRNRPDRNRQIMKDGWFLTGDRGCLDYQSNLFVTGHSTEVIIKGGFPVYSHEVEEVVQGLPHVLDVAVIGVPDPVFGEEIKACVVLKEGASIGPSEIIEYVKERVAVYKCPKIVRLFKELPRTPDGKIIRSQLRDEKS